MKLFSFFEDFCKNTVFVKVSISQKENEWLKTFVFAVTDVGIQEN